MVDGVNLLFKLLHILYPRHSQSDPVLDFFCFPVNASETIHTTINNYTINNLNQKR